MELHCVTIVDLLNCSRWLNQNIYYLLQQKNGFFTFQFPFRVSSQVSQLIVRGHA